MTVCKTGEAAAQASEPLLPTTSRSVASSSSSSLRSLQAESPPSYDSCTTSAGPVMYELETSWPVSDTVASGKAAGALGGTREVRPPLPPPPHPVPAPGLALPLALQHATDCSRPPPST